MLLNYLSTKCRFVAVIVSPFVLISCASKPPVIEAKPDNTVLNGIAESAKKIQGALNMMAKVEQYNSPDIKLYKRPDHGPLSKKISLRWHGDAVPAAKTVAQLIGFEFDVKGKRPVVPAVVNIEAIDQTAFDVLEDIGIQAGHKIGLLLSEDIKLIKVVYTEHLPKKEARP